MKKKATTTKPAAAFNLLAPNNVMSGVQEAMLKLYERRKNKTVSISAAGLGGEGGLPLPHFLLQYLFGRRWLPAGRAMEIVGRTGTGKSTLALFLAGCFASHANVPSVHVETENKEMTEDHIMRILHPDPQIARAIYEQGLRKLQSLELSSGIAMIEEIVRAFRGKIHTSDGAALPATVPVHMIVDTVSKWMSPGQAMGRLDWGEFGTPKAKSAMKEAGEGSNFEHAKLLAWWGRVMPSFLSQHNVSITYISHQNDKVDMGGTPSFIPKIYQDMHNTTKIGGRAIDQNVSFQLVVVPLEQAAKRADGTPTGNMVRVCMNKNSYGPNGRYIDYELRNEFFNDTAEALEHPLRFDEALAKWFASEGILGTTVERNLFTCTSLGVTGVDGMTLSKAFHANEDAMRRVGESYRIFGYAGVPEPEFQDDQKPAEEVAS